jgi:solute carrier family 39 (zinc transporter), member 1/2/3
MSSTVNCGSGGGSTTHTGLRIASLFIIWFGSTLGASFPIIARRSRFIRVPQGLFESVFLFFFLFQPFFSSLAHRYRFAKYFGSGVIIATGFIHLLSPGISELTSPCLGAAWQNYVRLPVLNSMIHSVTR